MWYNDGCSCPFPQERAPAPRGCGEGWGPAVRPQRLLRAFSMPVALVCVQPGQSPRETTLRAPHGATLGSFLILVLSLSADPLTALIAQKVWPSQPLLHPPLSLTCISAGDASTLGKEGAAISIQGCCVRSLGSGEWVGDCHSQKGVSSCKGALTPFPTYVS